MTIATHPTRDDIDLLDGHWWEHEPHEAWTWMREHAPVYWDAANATWGDHALRDVLAIEKDAKTFSSYRSPRPHGDPLPMMISMDDPQHLRRRKLVNKGFTPRRVREQGAADPRDLRRRSSTACASAASATSCGTSPRPCRCC